MLQLKKETDYAIQFLRLLSKTKNSVSLNDVAKTTGISFLFLQKIARRLRMVGLIKSKKGMDGGYFLALPSQKITLKKIIEAIEGKCGLLSCFSLGCAHAKNCCLRKKMSKLNNKIIKLLDGIKLKDL